MWEVLGITKELKEELKELRKEYAEMKEIYDNINKIPFWKKTREVKEKQKILGRKMYMHNLKQITVMNRLAGLNV